MLQYVGQQHISTGGYFFRSCGGCMLKISTESKKWNLKEEVIGDFNIPVVTSSNTFNKDQWIEMQEVAKRLTDNIRI